MTPSIIYWDLVSNCWLWFIQVFRGSQTGAVQPGDGSRDTLEPLPGPKGAPGEQLRTGHRE